MKVMICGAFNPFEANVEDGECFVGEVGIVAPCTQFVISDGACVAVALAAVEISYLQADSNRQTTRIAAKPILPDIERIVNIFPSLVPIT